MKKSKKYLMRKEKEAQIALMEHQDSCGIRRKRFKPTFFTLKRLSIIKIVLLSAGVVIYFIYSPLLFPILAAYAALYFISKKTEQDANFGLKKKLWIKVPKIDAFVALVLVALVLGGTVVSVVSTSTKSSMFEGMSKTAMIERMEANGMDTSKIDSMIERMEESGAFLSGTQKNILKIATCYTGQRVFFVEKNQMALGGGIRFDARSKNLDGGKPPDGGGVPPDGGKVIIKGPAEGSSPSLLSMPFDRIVNQIVSVVCFVLLIAVLASGIIVIIRSRKIKT